MTEYTVLAATGGSYHIVRTGVEARSARGAIHTVVVSMAEPPTEGKYVAVPARHWQEMSVRTSVQTKLEIDLMPNEQTDA